MIRMKAMVRLCAGRVKFSVPKAPTFSDVAEPGDSPNSLRSSIDKEREVFPMYEDLCNEKLSKVLDPYIETGYTITNHESAPFFLPQSCGNYDEPLKSFCDKLQVHTTVDFLDSILARGLTVQSNMLNYILKACDASSAYTLVHNIYSIINHHNIKPNRDAIRCMISMYVKMKDFNGAYRLINGLRRWNLKPNANMFNVIMSGYFEQKNFHEGLMVLKKMDASNVKPDDRTFSNIIRYCNSEDDIIKYHNKMHESGVQPTKHVFKALIKAYTACGLVEKAKHVVANCHNTIPADCVNEVIIVFGSTLVFHGQIADALKVFVEARHVRFSSIFHNLLQSEGELSQLLQLLKQLQGTNRWVEGCAVILSYCVRYKLLGSAIDLLNQLKERWHTEMTEITRAIFFDEVYLTVVRTNHTQFGWDLYQAIKEHIGIQPSMSCLDVLLIACIGSRDLERSFLVWKEYQKAGFPCSMPTVMWMYEALLVSGADKAAQSLLECINDDNLEESAHLRAFQVIYRKSKF